MSGRYKQIYTLLARRLVLVFSLVAVVISIGSFLNSLVRYDLLPFIWGVAAAILGAALAFALAEGLRLARTRRTVFVAYNHRDADFVIKLVNDLKGMNLDLLVDRLELKVGEDIRTAVDRMIDKSDYFLFVISQNSATSNWAKKELEQALSRKKKILPAVLNADVFPPELSGIFYADFSQNYDEGLEQLRRTFGSP